MATKETLPESYVKVKHERDNVVKGFNKLKAQNLQLAQDILEMRTLVNELIEAYGDNRSIQPILTELQVLV